VRIFKILFSQDLLEKWQIIYYFNTPRMPKFVAEKIFGELFYEFANHKGSQTQE
jgi:hypothetical protein